MPLFKRSDGELVHHTSSLRKMMPLLMPRRNDSIIYFEIDIDVSNTLSYLAKKTEFSFFNICLASVVRVLALRPQLNRFVVGGRVYQRKQIALSFAVKKQMADHAAMTAVKAVFDPTDTLSDVSKKANDAIQTGRRKKDTASEKEMNIVTRLPNWAVKCILALQRQLDAFNLLPKQMLDSDPLYASVFLANLGSIGLDAPFHHLYEYGTVPLFGAVGKIHKAPMVDENNQVVAKDVVTMRFTMDERITDGFYCAKCFQMFVDFIKNPEQLESPL